ncbi:MAG: hypothetical protein Q4E41_04900 [Bacteroidales bacterium]|nr:hypothetical protein [Bacteroidales bacterium]
MDQKRGGFWSKSEMKKGVSGVSGVSSVLDVSQGLRVVYWGKIRNFVMTE